MATELIWEILWRASLIAAIIYTIDYATDGKLDLPHWKIEWEETRMARWIKRLQRKTQ